MSFIPNIKNEFNKIGSSIEHEGGKLYKNVKTGAKSAGKFLESSGKSIESDIKSAGRGIESGIKGIPDDISSVGHYIQSGVLQAGDTISTLEGDVAPSFNKIIGETGLVIAGIIAVALVALKF